MSNQTLITINELFNRFQSTNTWEDRYRQLIILSRQLPEMDPILKTAENEIKGCENRVWLDCQMHNNGQFSVTGDSEGRIVKGLLAILLIAIQDKSPSEISQMDFTVLFTQLGIEQQLSGSRQQGLAALITRIQQCATKAITSAEK